MFKIESYVTPILLSYVDKYVRDFKPVDAQVSLWGGGVVLHNLVLKADVLQQEVALPFTLVSGRIHELHIQVPWTKIMSEPIIVTIDTIECVLSLNPPVAPDGIPQPASPSRKSQVVEAPPGYMQALVRRIVSNISLRVHHLIVKYVQDDIVMSLNVKHLAVDSAGANWEPAFADIEQTQPLIRRLVRLDDLTLCLDKSDGDGKIRFFQEPLLYRCQLDLRVLTHLISANTRRATSLDVQLRSTKLAFSVTNEQLALLLRLVKERPVIDVPAPMPKQLATQMPLSSSSSTAVEPARSESWSEWAWSWLPTWEDREQHTEEAPVTPTPLPLTFNAYFDDVSLVFKVMETEANNRKRARDVLELCASYAALKSSVCNPTYVRVHFGARQVTMRSQGKCVCGFVNYNTANLNPTVYLQKASKPESSQEDDWTWPEEVLNEKVEATVEAVEEAPGAEQTHTSSHSKSSQAIQEGDPTQSLETASSSSKLDAEQDVDELWKRMEPLVYVQYVHERSPPNALTNPYDNPPKEFEYSDWVEECSMSITLAPVHARVCMGLIHRLMTLNNIFKEQALQLPELPRRVLTVEENESLSENLPQRRIKVEVRDMRVCLVPWDHSDRPSRPTLLMEIELPYTNAVVTAPMYPQRVCSAASQMPTDTGILWQGARRHLTLTANVVQVRLSNYDGTETRPCARVDIKLVTHELLHKEFFAQRQSVEFAYNFKIAEMNVCGSSARLQAALEVPLSLFNQQRSFPLQNTTLPHDALHDQNAVAVDITLEDFSMRGYITNNIKTHVVALQSAKITALQESKSGEMTQAWLFSAPDAPTSTPYLRLAFQWCDAPVADSLDYCGLWTEPLAMSVDPLLISWLAYRPHLKSESLMKAASSQQILRRRTPPSSSGRGGSRGSVGAELVHVRARSHGSSSEPSEIKEHKIPTPKPQPQPQDTWLSAEQMSKVHNRLRSMLLNVELGLALVYVTMSTASAVNCATLRDAMERHAAEAHRVLVFCLGRLSMQSNSLTRRLWLDIQHDGPTFLKDKPKEEAFPWKICLADVSCYTLEVRSLSQAATAYRSTLKATEAATVRTVLDLVTTSITVSVVTKRMKFMALSKESSNVKKAREGTLPTPEEQTKKYFMSGPDFRPSNLKEFLRGPSNRKKTEKKINNESLDETPPPPSVQYDPLEQVIYKDGPLISLGVNLHADTPPIILRLEQDQVKIVAAAIHCLTHVRTLLSRPLVAPRPAAPAGGSHKPPLVRTSSELEEIQSASEDTSDNNPPEMIAIFDRATQYQRPLKTFFWFQWVVSRVTLVVASETVKLALDIDDVIGTVDFQAEYNQLKLKLASASIKHYHRGFSDEWVAGVVGGRVLEAREPLDAKEDGHFLSITVTKARVSHLPPNWKEDLQAKLMERSNATDYMWEVYAMLAPLEAIIQPNIIDNVMSLVRELAPRADCPLRDEIEPNPVEFQWPLCYLSAGGIRVLVTGGDTETRRKSDDTIILTVGKIKVNPQPENPICRRAVNATTADGVWTPNGGFEGRQYEVLFKNVSVQSGKFKDITLSEAVGTEKKGSGSENNPAVKWSQRNQLPQMVPILHTMELSLVFAPPMYINSVLAFGSAVELNLLSDCSLDFSVTQLVLFKQLGLEFGDATGDHSCSGEAMTGGFVCPYAKFFKPATHGTYSEPSTRVNVSTIPESSRQMNLGRMTSDSGVETVASSSKTRVSDDATMKKTASVIFAETLDPSQYMEVFLTVGVIEISLYAIDRVNASSVAPKVVTKPLKEGKSEKTKDGSESATSTDTYRSLTYTPEKKVEATMNVHSQAKDEIIEGKNQLLLITLFQPNVYYWKRKTQKTLQLFLFNTRLAIGMGPEGTQWQEDLLTTAKGESDRVTGIPPALANFKMVTSTSSASGPSSSLNSQRGRMSLDIERPVQVDLSTAKLRRLKAVLHLLKQNLFTPDPDIPEPDIPFLYRLKNKLINESVESITIHTSQLSVCGKEGAIGWDSSSLQVCTSARPEGVTAKGLVTALLVSAGPPGDFRHVVMQPVMLGMELEAIWEAWRRAECGASALEPTVQISVELDKVAIELVPDMLPAVRRLLAAYQEVSEEQMIRKKTPEATSSSDSGYERSQFSESLPRVPKRNSLPTLDNDDSDHFYKDDLRSGAFKILSGGQLPMAYQVMLSGNAVSWRYPHPRAITRIVAFPLPGQDSEIDCVLEMYSSVLERWEPHTYFKLPVGEPREMQLFVSPPETVFATMWRFRACAISEPSPPPYEFSINKFKPTKESQTSIDPLEPVTEQTPAGVTAEQLSGVLRVDSYFAPRLLPRTNAVLRVANLLVHVHNSLPVLHRNAHYIAEGYYVSKPLMRTHRVLSLLSRNTAAHALCSSPAGTLVVADTRLSCDMIDCSTGTMEAIIEEFRMQAGLSTKESLLASRSRVMTSGIHAALQVPRLKTLQALVNDWANAYDKFISPTSNEEEVIDDEVSKKSKGEVMKLVTEALEGRVSLWVHNNCSCVIRVGQDETDEVFPLAPGAQLAYRWHSPTAPKRLRFALVGPSAQWNWSSSISFREGSHRLKIESLESEKSKLFYVGSYLNVKVEESQATRCMTLSGRLVLANMLRSNLLYKVRSHDLGSPQWYTVTSGELPAEAIGRSVVCSAECDMGLKIKFSSQNTCWSGDIPLKECPKENVPWLVKVPTAGESQPQFVSVWCRVVRGRVDGRILVTIWPLYVLHSHLPLDTDVLIATDTSTSNEESVSKTKISEPLSTTQTTPGRGASTHLLAPGTTSARHSLSFQYKNVDCPVTREAVPMHYGVTDTSVFDKRSPVLNIDDVIKDIKKWLDRSSAEANTKWPYSVVYRHWNSEWQPAALQPRCDVTVRYQAVRAGGGCCLELLLCPMVLLCNATPVALTLRSYDAAPLCKLQSGTAISPPTVIIQKPFFISVEIGRETFVSSQLQVSTEDPGRYGTPPPGQVALDHAANFSILCNQKVALLTLYYEIKEHIHVLGVSSSYVLVNRLDTDVSVATVALPNDSAEGLISLRPQNFRLIPPTEGRSTANGTPIHRFYLRKRWRGGDPAELSTFMCFTLPDSTRPALLAAPVRLGHAPLRRALALVDADAKSIPVVVTQMKQDSRWIVVVAPDPCPQFLVHNHTSITLCIAQPHTPDEASSSRTEALPECAGVKWWCKVPPGTAVHYSSPAYCARYPPDTAPAAATSPILTISKGRDESEMEWCSPVVAADGEQLLQYFGGVTIKLRVRTHPHSTLLELQDVDHNDISASDIRRRLIGAFEMSETDEKKEEEVPITNPDDDFIELHTSNKTNLFEGDRFADTTRRISALSSDSSRRKVQLMDMYSNSSETRVSTSLKYPSEDMFRSVILDPDLDDLDDPWVDSERFRCVIAGMAVELSAEADVMPLLELHLDRTTLLVQADSKKIKTTLSIVDAQIDNLQYDTGQYDFAVVASTRATPLAPDQWPPLWNMFALNDTFATRAGTATMWLKLTHDKWEIVDRAYTELTEMEIRVGTLALYIEDAYVKALVDMSRLLLPAGNQDLSEERAMQQPLRLRLLHVHPLDLTLTLHTAVRMYIALDQSPLRLSAFKLHDMMTSAERLTHALTVHYLSAAILGAGWVVGGLELLGAPGALAARVGGATGGVRGVASAAAAALLRSLSAWAGSLARNLDLLAGDEEHARRAAAARRRPPPSFVAGLMAGITNFAINILGAVGGLAHHPLVGVAVGETESGAAGLRRGLLGALTKPLSATADLVAYAGSGLLRQTGWDPVPEPRRAFTSIEARKYASWRRDCVRWTFRLCELTVLGGFEVLLDNAPLQLLLTHKFLVLADRETERIVEMIDFKFCTLEPYQGQIIVLIVTQAKKQARAPETKVAHEDDENQINAAAMARVARYTGAEGSTLEEDRLLSLLPPPGRSYALHAALAAALHHNSDTHFPLL